jgi:hypothetical protein
MDANCPQTPPDEAIRRWRDGLRELETLTHTERLQSTYAERFRAIQQLYAFWKLLGKFPDPTRAHCATAGLKPKRRWIEKHMPSRVNF